MNIRHFVNLNIDVKSVFIVNSTRRKSWIGQVKDAFNKKTMFFASNNLSLNVRKSLLTITVKYRVLWERIVDKSRGWKEEVVDF